MLQTDWFQMHLTHQAHQRSASQVSEGLPLLQIGAAVMPPIKYVMRRLPYSTSENMLGQGEAGTNAILHLGCFSSI